MRIWEGPLVIPKPAIRGGEQPKGETVHARVVLKEPTAVPVIDVRDGVDGVGNPRWRAATPREFDPVSILRALAMTSPEVAE
jgi:hypothetical protein